MKISIATNDGMIVKTFGDEEVGNLHSSADLADFIDSIKLAVLGAQDLDRTQEAIAKNQEE
jgi:hypothetical protein